MMSSSRVPTHPGEVLRHELLDPLGLAADDLVDPLHGDADALGDEERRWCAGD